MLRTIAILIAFGSCTCAGLLAAQRLRARRDLLKELSEAVQTLLAGIRHTARPVWELLRCCGGAKTRLLFWETAAAAEAGERVYDAFFLRAEQSCVFADATLEDRRLMEDFFAMLGRSMRQSQQENGEMILEALRKNQREASEAYEGKGRVYRAMGALTGAGVAILLL